MSSPLLSLSHVSVGSRQGKILDDINLTLMPGHFMGIVGPNGAGKSTLLSVITGSRKVDCGHIDLFGHCLKRHNRRRLLRKLGFLNQAHSADTHIPVLACNAVAMGLPAYGAPLWRRTVNRAAIEDALEKVGMMDSINSDYRELSGGQRQRIRIARALVGKPALLLLDEPSAGLDSSSQEGLFRLLRKLCDEEGLSVIMVEHDVSAITSYVDSVACLNRHIHYHAGRGEHIPEWVWKGMYGDHVRVMVHDAACIGCEPEQGGSR